LWGWKLKSLLAVALSGASTRRTTGFFAISATGGGVKQGSIGVGIAGAII